MKYERISKIQRAILSVLYSKDRKLKALYKDPRGENAPPYWHRMSDIFPAPYNVEYPVAVDLGVKSLAQEKLKRFYTGESDPIRQTIKLRRLGRLKYFTMGKIVGTTTFDRAFSNSIHNLMKKGIIIPRYEGKERFFDKTGRKKTFHRSKIADIKLTLKGTNILESETPLKSRSTSKRITK